MRFEAENKYLQGKQWLIPFLRPSLEIKSNMGPQLTNGHYVTGFVGLSMNANSVRVDDWIADFTFISGEEHTEYLWIFNARKVLWRKVCISYISGVCDALAGDMDERLSGWVTRRFYKESQHKMDISVNH